MWDRKNLNTKLTKKHQITLKLMYLNFHESFSLFYRDRCNLIFSMWYRDRECTQEGIKNESFRFAFDDRIKDFFSCVRISLNCEKQLNFTEKLLNLGFGNCRTKRLKRWQFCDDCKAARKKIMLRHSLKTFFNHQWSVVRKSGYDGQNNLIINFFT